MMDYKIYGLIWIKKFDEKSTLTEVSPYLFAHDIRCPRILVLILEVKERLWSEDDFSRNATVQNDAVRIGHTCSLRDA